LIFPCQHSPAPQTATERAAAFHPIRGIEHLSHGFIGPPLQRRDQPPDILPIKHPAIPRVSSSVSDQNRSPCGMLGFKSRRNGRSFFARLNRSPRRGGRTEERKLSRCMPSKLSEALGPSVTC
jgi:hypothetical protein